MPLFQLQQSRTFDSFSDYIQTLEEQCSIRVDAVKIASKLIMAYQQENKSLKEQKKNLQQIINQLQRSKSQVSVQCKHPTPAQNLLLSEKISSLLQKHIEYEQRISYLERQLLISKRELELLKNKQRHKRPKADHPLQKEILPGKTQEKLIQRKLEEKEEEIFYLVRRLNHMEERCRGLQAVKSKERVQTCNLMTASSLDAGLSRKFNSSIQTVQP